MWEVPNIGAFASNTHFLRAMVTSQRSRCFPRQLGEKVASDGWLTLPPSVPGLPFCRAKQEVGEQLPLRLNKRLDSPLVLKKKQKNKKTLSNASLRGRGY